MILGRNLFAVLPCVKLFAKCNSSLRMARAMGNKNEKTADSVRYSTIVHDHCLVVLIILGGFFPLAAMLIAISGSGQP